MTTPPAHLKTTPPLADSTGTGVRVTAQGFTYQHADRDHPALAGVDLEISPGEKVLLAGPSGAGKSTLLHAMAGVLHDDDADAGGHLHLDGLTPQQARGRAGLMQQDPESQVVLSRIGDDVAFACENLGVAPEAIPSRVNQALAAVGLENLGLDQPSSALSGGQKQRLALAGILAMQPGLLLLDEPTANIDPAGTTRVRDSVIAAAQNTSATLVVVEHRLETWIDHVDTLIVLEPGGGVRHRVPASAFHKDQGLRAELAEAGLWVGAASCCNSEQCQGIFHSRSARATQETLPDKALLRADKLAVHLRSPKTSWRRTPPPKPVLSGVDLHLSPGRAYGITGHNGAGKSTLLLTLGGLLEPHGGTLTAAEQLKGSHGSELPDAPFGWRSADLTSRIGTVFQEPEHQFVRNTVEDELRLSAERARIPGTREPLFTHEQVTGRVSALLRRLKLTHLVDANPFTLSGGEKRRLSVGTALAAGPEVLMLDEPTFGQDAHTFAELIDLLREHLDSGGTVIAVTHDQDFLTALDAQEYDVATASSSAPTSDPTPPGTPLLSAVRDTSWLGQRGPLAKLIALALITVALIATIDPVSALVVAAASFALLPLANIRLLTFLRRIWIFAVAALMAVWGAAIAAEESGTVLVDLGITTISTGSLELGLALGARAFAIVLPSVLIFSTTDPTDLADALAQQLKLPARFVLGALAAMRLLGLMAEHWTTLGHARRARGLGTRFFSQAFGLLVQAIRMATRLAVTMESRGFKAGQRTWARQATFTRADALVVLGGAVIAAGATTAAIAAGTWNLVWVS